MKILGFLNRMNQHFTRLFQFKSGCHLHKNNHTVRCGYFYGILRYFKCSGQVNCPCAKVLPAAKRLYGAKAPPRCAGPQSCPASILCGQDKKKDTLQSVSFFLGSGGHRPPPPFGDSNARGRQSRPCAILRCAPNSRRIRGAAQKGRLKIWQRHLYFMDKTKRNTSLLAGVSFWIPGDF